jgi:SCF-associated factor 1
MSFTHWYPQISAHFDTSVAYSVGTASVVLMSFNDASTEVPKIIPALQNRGIISVVLGDYFKAALTASGKLLTW